MQQHCLALWTRPLVTPRAGRKDYFCGRGLAGGKRAVSCPLRELQGRDALHSRLVVEGRRRDVLGLMCSHLGGLRAGRLRISPPGPATRAAREGGRRAPMKLCASRARGRTLQPLVVAGGGRPAIGALSINRWRVRNVGYRGVKLRLTAHGAMRGI